MRELLSIFLLTLAMAQAADEVPQWLREIATSTLPKYDAKTPAAVLLSEERVLVEENGRVQTSTRHAVKILTREGRDRAVARRVYRTDSGKVRELRAWMIYPSGEVKKFGKDQTLDASLADNDVYNEVRVRAIVAASSADPGAVFGFESISKDRSVFTQFEWHFQDYLPARASRFSITLPAGWRAEGVAYNHPALTPEISGSSYTWQLRDLAPIEDEESSPRITSLAPRLAVSYFPPDAKAGVAFRSWTDVSRWLASLNDSQAALTGPLTEKAKTLAAGVSSELEKIEAIGRFAQSVQYVSIQTGTGRGGGYRPHLASDVLTKLYGDCKDKANLMRALLKGVGIESYPVAIYSGDPRYVRPDWPSPQQFNHAIIAVRVSAEAKAPAVAEHPSLGRLLFFDPTDEHTPVGLLPDHEQDSYALVVAGDAGALMKMPAAEASANRLERRTEVTLDANGSIQATLSEKCAGQSAVDSRRLFRRRARPDYIKTIESWITHGAGAAKVAKVEPRDDPSGGFSLDVEFSADSYAQLMQGRLMVFRPAVIGRSGEMSMSEPKRKHALVIEGRNYGEVVEVRLPPGFTVDESPEPLTLTAPFGTYSAVWEPKTDRLIFTRKLELRPAVVPPEGYAEAREFFGKINGAEQTPVVLVRR